MNIAKSFRGEYSLEHLPPALSGFDTRNTTSYEIKVLLRKIKKA